MSAERLSVALRGRVGSFALDAAFEAPLTGVTALFGPSGSGKTTILRAVAGLTRIDGRIALGPEVWQDDATREFVKPHRRPVGTVFQEASLFPHLSVRNNLLYGARRAVKNGVPQRIGEDEIIALLGIGHLLARAPHALSGGERQRVAVGRALLSQPRLLLMDEPLSALDRTTKEEILPYFEALHDHLSIPILYVSHDYGEIQRLADSLVLIEAGRVIGAGPLPALQASPDLPLLQTPDAAVTLEGSVLSVDREYELTRFAVPGGVLIVPGIWDGPGELGRLQISAADVSFTLSPPRETTILNCLSARIVSVRHQENGRSQVNIVAALGEDGAGARIIARITRKSQEALGLAEGTIVFAQIKSVALIASAVAAGAKVC